MTGRPPAHDALRLLRNDLLDGHGDPSGLTAAGVWQAFLRFGRRRFDSPLIPDADGLLYQYGSYTFQDGVMFSLDFTRQFDVPDADGEHDHFLQVHCELRYEPLPSLQALGAFESWFFHDTEAGRVDHAELDAWAAEVEAGQAWALVHSLPPVDIQVYTDTP